MLFQTLDDKKECIAFFINNEFIHENIPQNISHTWSYSSYLKDINIEYANLYVDGKSLEEICPDHLKNEYNEVTLKLKAIINSLVEAKISLKDNCFYDLVPNNFLQQYCIIKNKICDYIFINYKKPIEYEFYKNFTQILDDIKNRNLNIDLEYLKPKISDEKAFNLYKKILNSNSYIDYNLFGTITGRLTTLKNSFPILTLPSTYRSVIKPTNDWLVAFDMNAAELRTSIALIDKDQPEEDFYEMLKKEVYDDKLNRSTVKQITTSWLYNSGKSNNQEYSEKLDNVFNKERLLNTYWDGKYVHTPFSRKIESDKFHAIPYLNQSTFIDLFHRQAIKVDNYLKNKKSFIAFFLHDEFVIDVSEDEKENLIDIIKIIQNTEFGKYIVNVKAGKDYGNMKKLKLKV